MPQRRRQLLHREGPALWPRHKPLAEVIKLRDTTPENIWFGTYQGVPTPAAGATFRRDWWAGGVARYYTDRPDEQPFDDLAVQRILSYDTAFKDKETSDYTGAGVFVLLPDYRLLLTRAEQIRLETPDIADRVRADIERYNRDGKLSAVIIEDRASGISTLQTLAKTLPYELAQLLVPYPASVSKVERAGQAAVWCKNGMVELPHPSAAVPWLADFEDQLFTFPSGVHDDMVDMFSQAIIYFEHYLAAGYHARNGVT